MKHLKPLLPIMGKWAGEVTLRRDMAGVGKEGDRVPVVCVYKWTKNKNAIVLNVETNDQGPSVNVTNGLIVWDALNKKIIGLDAYAEGGLLRYEIQSQGDKLVLRGRGTTADGLRTVTTIEFTILSTDSFTAQFINQREDDTEIPDGPPIKLTRLKE